MTVISGPVPPCSNPPIEAQFYQPSRFVITDVALGMTTIVTTGTVTNYVIGQLVRLLIPFQFGCRQLNEVSGYIISFPSTYEIEIEIDSSVNVDPYVAGTATVCQPQILALGNINSGIISSTGTVNLTTNIPGAFINISPI